MSRHRRRSRLRVWLSWKRRLPAGTLAWLAPLVVLGAVLAVLLASSLIPYRPFTLSSYRVFPMTVCAGAPVRAEVTREFTSKFNYLRLAESWVTVSGVEGYEPDRPVSTEAAELPVAALKPSGSKTVLSPLLTEAPELPGTYRVRIIAEFQGSRFGFLPAIGSSTFTSDNLVEVVACPPPPPPDVQEED